MRRARLGLRLALVTAVALAGATVRASDALPAPIAVTNFVDGDVVRHPVVLLRGSAPADATSVTVTNEASARDTKELLGLARKGRFLALAELMPGENRLVVRAAGAEQRLSLKYRPQTNPRFVRCVYLTDSTGDTAYQTPLDKDPQDFPGKLDTAMKVLQCFTAERMNDLGFGRRTFRLELDADGRVPVHVVRGEKPAADEYLLDDQAWWRETNALLHKTLPEPRAKNVVVAAYTRFDPATKKVHGHTALGGGDQGLFGSAGMFAWPTRLADVLPAFSDTTPVDGSRVHDDSAGRSTHWGLASTTLGAVLHETGHTFDLPHTNHPMDVMTRGFDHLNRAFSLVEPPGRSGGDPREFREDEIACFAPISAASLRANPWFALDDRKDSPGDGPSIEYDDDVATIRAPRGLRFVGLMLDGVEIAFQSFWGEGRSPPTELRIREGDLVRAEGVATTIRAVDAAGQSIAEPVRFPRWFVRRWRVDPRTKPWTDRSQFVRFEPRELVLADSGKPVALKTAYLDLLAQFGRGSHDVVAYAASTIRVETRRKMRLLCGSDDALRVFVDGKPVLERLVMRGARPDEDAADVELDAGSHVVVAEVSQGGGDWGLYLRFVDPGGEPIAIGDDGRFRGDGAVPFLAFSDPKDPDVAVIGEALARAGIARDGSQSAEGVLVLRRSDMARAMRALKADPAAAPALRVHDRWRDGDEPLDAWRKAHATDVPAPSDGSAR